ncbi:MAG: MBL fold metallo-hydrolase [Ruminococcaceae bacterium]|nr:MBL fold metallo-hydrolase [Oscillospiraceae bacterium]
MARFTPLFSGSKGNCIAVGGADSFVLIDAGVSAKRITDALRERGLDICRLTGIFITHEHSDHISGVRVLASKHKLPVFANGATLKQLEAGGHLAGTGGGIEIPDCGMEHYGTKITPFATCHDTVQSCGYVVETADGRKAAVATDTGCVTDSMHHALTGCHLVYIESNHDVGMVMSGRYEPWLKQRVLSPHGHLSNDACAVELQYLAASGSARFCLGHLSEENNRPELARSVAHKALTAMQLREGIDFTLDVAPPCGLPLTLF